MLPCLKRYSTNFVKGGAHMLCIDLSGIHASTLRIWVLRSSALQSFKHSNLGEIHNGIMFLIFTWDFHMCITIALHVTVFEVLCSHWEQGSCTTCACIQCTWAINIFHSFQWWDLLDCGNPFGARPGVSVLHTILHYLYVLLYSSTKLWLGWVQER